MPRLLLMALAAQAVLFGSALHAQDRYPLDPPAYEVPRDRLGALPSRRFPADNPEPRGPASARPAWPEETRPELAPERPREPRNDIPRADGPAPAPAAEAETRDAPPLDLGRWLAPESATSSLQTMALVSVVSLAPAILLMTTCFVRITIVLGLLRQALGTPQLPPTQVLTSIALFLTLLVMAPVWKASYEQGVKPYVEHKIGLDEAWHAGVQPIRQFMILQIERTGNAEDIWLFLDYSGGAEPFAEGNGRNQEPSTYADVPLTALAPAFLLSELKTAFLIGFQIYLPFVVLDMVVSSVMVSMGMVMVPPTTVSFPLKLLLFVLVDGWRLVVGMLLESFVPFT